MKKQFAGVAVTMLVAAAALCASLPARAQQPVTISVIIKNHRFQPAELHAPANVPIMLKVKNLDATPMEFESVSLRVEKVVTPNSEGMIRLRPLAPGSYNFFDDFNQEANGVLVVK
ncbi:MAG TPA: cupredoxin domain-containing protein [Pseudolabrys sp.]|nr:cupredoxin domain-containing protein [Pseudolabrys sp.]